MVKENGFSKIGWCAPFVRNASYDTTVLKFIVGDGRPFESAAGCECFVLTNGS